MALDKKIAPPLYSLNQCNPRLSGNIKFVCDDDDIYIDSISSNSELSRVLYKSYKVNNRGNLMANAKNFFDLFTTTDSLFEVKKSKNFVVDNYQNQHERIYNYGAYSDASELIKKRFRFFAPIYINEEATKPDLFLIYKVDRSKINTNGDWKKELVYTHDFRTSQMGEQLDRHINYLKEYPHDMGIYVNFGNNISYTGTSIESGLMESRYEDDFDSLLANERTITEFNNYVVDGFKRNNLIDSRYLNLEYTFDIQTETQQNNDTFLDVIGVYVKLDEFGNITEYNNSTSDFKLIENSGTVTDGSNSITDSDLADNFINVGTHLGVQYNSSDFIGNFSPLIMIKPNFIPNVGDKIELAYDNEIELSYTITESDVVKNDIKKTAENICTSITKYAKQTPSNIFIDAMFYQNEFIVIRSLITENTYNNIVVSTLPKQYQIIEPIFSKTDYKNTFYSPNTNSVITSIPVGLKNIQADSLRLGENVSSINFASKWLNLYFYDTDSALKESDSDPEIFESIRTEKSKMYNSKIIEHRKFDFDRETTYHEDVFDFELDVYRNWLINEVSKDTFLGKYKNNIDGVDNTTLSEYKAELLTIIERYFNSISLNRNMLFKDINTDDFEATTVENEYDRLKENDNYNLLKTNTTIQHINKFMYANGLDVYNRPYLLNISLPFRYGNFSPSLDNTNRDLRDSTHSWLVIGEGLPPYFSSIEIDGKNVISKVEVETEQVINVIERINENIGTTEDIEKWETNDVVLQSDDNNEVLIYNQSNSLGSIKRNLNISEQSKISLVNFEYNFNIKSSANLNVGVRLELVSVLNDNIVYNTWDINKNIIGGETLNINSVERFKLPQDASEVYLRLSVPIGFSCTLEIIDLNFFKGTITQNTLNDTINFDSDNITGTFKYIPDMISGYTTIPISVNDIKSKNTDVFNYIRSHATIREEDGKGTCFFRGVKCVVSKKYVGWKFSSVLITKTAPSGKDRSIELYENEKFNSLVLLVNMYIPEPVLTSLEQPDTYWLDRSILYFSDGNYDTEDSLASFGSENLSVKIRDVGTPKTYLGNVVTNDWYFQSNGKNYVHVNKGILSRFNVDFTSILYLGKDFVATFSNVDDSETENFGMVVTFKNIQEIKEDYFWCEEISVKIKEVNDGVVEVIEYDMLDTFLNNNDAFTTDNKMDIVESILLENTKYDRVLKNTSAKDRFSLISTASIFDWLNAHKVKVINQDGEIHYDTIGAFRPTVNESIISYKEVNNDIVNLDLKYTNTFARQNGAYEPVTKRLRKSQNDFLIDYIDYGNSNKASNNDLVPTIKTNLDRGLNSVWFYRNNYANINLSNHYRYYSNRKDFKNLDWFSNPTEYKNEVSRILSSTKILSFNYTYENNDINIFQNIKKYLLTVLQNSGFSESNYTVSEKIDIIKLSEPTIDISTLDQFDFTEIILERFHNSVFSRIYNVVRIEDSNGDKYDFLETSDNEVRLIDDVSLNTELTIILDRI